MTGFMEDSVVLFQNKNKKVAKEFIQAGNRLLFLVPMLQVIALVVLEFKGVTGLDDFITLLGFLGIPLLYTQLKLKGRFKEVFKLRALKWKAIVPLMLITLAMQPISTFLFMISTAIFGNHMDLLFKDILNQAPLMLFFTLCVVPAIGEEFIMRGIVLHLYSPMKGYIQVLINGFLFGIFHQNINQFSYSCFIGMVLALAVILTKSIWSGVIIHFLNNFLSYLEYELDFTLINDTVNQPINWVIVIGLSLLAVAVLYKLFYWLNAIYREEGIKTFLTGEDEGWVVEKNCEKLPWTSMWTVSMWLNIVLFIGISAAIIFESNHVVG